MLQPSFRLPAREHSHPPATPSTFDSQIDDRPADAPALLPAETSISCARLTDHEWQWLAEPSARRGGHPRYVMRCRVCHTIGAHVDHA